MEQQLNFHDQFNRLISGFLADQSNLSDIDPVQLSGFIEKYPFCQPLHFIEAALQYQDKADDDLSRAALYSPKREILYKIVHQPGSLQPPVIDWTATSVKAKRQDAIPEQNNEPDDLVPESIISSDFFAFEKRVEEPVRTTERVAPQPPPDPPSPARPLPEQASPAAPADDRNTVNEISRYDDDKMPYTFQWWLSKTRKEHAHTYQPYATSLPPAKTEVKKNSGGDLNNQILENIFHLKNQVEEPGFSESTNADSFRVNHKDNSIIERFIREEPQIRPLQAEKIDAENKARKSSEDQNDLVSETLAKIYAEQMLYSKAADTYRKLRLKFPEKSAYFADQIRQLERKA